MRIAIAVSLALAFALAIAAAASESDGRATVALLFTLPKNWAHTVRFLLALALPPFLYKY